MLYSIKWSRRTVIFGVMQTRVKVRVQANGGKYLGPAVAGDAPMLTVTIPDAAAPLGPLVFPTGSSGEVYPSSPPRRGLSPHSTGYTPGTYLLGAQTTPPLFDSYLVVVLDLPAGQTNVRFDVQAFSPQPVNGSTSVTLTGGVDLLEEPGVVVLVNGLRVTNVAAYVDGNTTNITANVAMMCGCMITPDTIPPKSVAEPYWPAYEFAVTANVFGFAQIALACTDVSKPSVFTGSLPYAVPEGTVVSIAAQQEVTGNRNVAVTAVVAAGAATLE